MENSVSEWNHGMEKLCFGILIVLNVGGGKGGDSNALPMLMHFVRETSPGPVETCSDGATLPHSRTTHPPPSPQTYTWSTVFDIHFVSLHFRSSRMTLKERKKKID